MIGGLRPLRDTYRNKFERITEEARKETARETITKTVGGATTRTLDDDDQH